LLQTPFYAFQKKFITKILKKKHKNGTYTDAAVTLHLPEKNEKKSKILQCEKKIFK